MDLIDKYLIKEFTVSDVQLAMKKKGKVDKEAIEKLKKLQHMGNITRDNLKKVGHGKLIIEKYLGEAKKKPIPKVKGKGKYNFGIKFDPEGWYQKPEMMGHRWAKESLDSLEAVMNMYSKSKLQKYIIDKAYGTPAEVKRSKDTWHYFANNVTKKSITNLQFVLRKVDTLTKSGMYGLLRNVERKAGMLKNRLNWALEVLSYKYDYDVYLEWYLRDYGLLGLSPEEAKERFEKYHKGISKKLEGKEKGF